MSWVSVGKEEGPRRAEGIAAGKGGERRRRRRRERANVGGGARFLRSSVTAVGANGQGKRESAFYYSAVFAPLAAGKAVFFCVAASMQGVFWFSFLFFPPSERSSQLSERAASGWCLHGCPAGPRLNSVLFCYICGVDRLRQKLKTRGPSVLHFPSLNDVKRGHNTLPS